MEHFTIYTNIDDFKHVFESIWIKISVSIFTILGCLSCTGLGSISWFERSGEAGPFRTLINQLVTLALDQISVIFLSGAILEILRFSFGPLPTFACRFFLFTYLWACLNSLTFITLISVVKFTFLCVYKSIPLMIDNFLSLYIFVVVIFINFLSLFGKFYIEEKILITERICTGVWVEEDKFKTGIPLAVVYCIVLFGIQFSLGLPILYHKYLGRKILKVQKNQTDLGPLISTMLSGLIFTCASIAFFVMQK